MKICDRSVCNEQFGEGLWFCACNYHLSDRGHAQVLVVVGTCQEPIVYDSTLCFRLVVVVCNKKVIVLVENALIAT